MDYLNEIDDLQSQIDKLRAEIKNINKYIVTLNLVKGEVLEMEEDKEIKSLRHYRDTTVGLWATDKPEKVQDPEKVLFRLEEM